MKKRFLPVLMLLLLLLLSGSAMAADCSAVSCAASESDENGIYTVSVELEDCTGLAMIQFALQYDPELMECVSAESGELLNDTEAPTVNAEISGEIYFVWDSLEPLETDGQLLQLKMRLLTEEPAELSFDFEEDCIFAEEDFSEIELFTNGCTVGERETEETASYETESEDIAAAEPEASGLWPVLAIAGGAVIVAAVCVFLRIKKRPQGKH